MTDEGAPKDRGCLVGIIFFILGLGTLLPWNFFMTASQYFNNRLTLNTSDTNDDTVIARKEYYFDNWMTLLSQLPLLLFTLLNSFLYPRISETMRIAGSLVCILILFIFTAILVKVDMEQDRFFSVTMATIWFINSFGAVLQGSLFGLVGLLPQKYSTMFMSGQGLAGTFAAVAMILALASNADDETAALGYFITPCVGTLVTLMSYLLLSKLRFAQHYLCKNKSKSYEPETTNQLLLTEDTTTENGKANGHTNGSPVANGSMDATPSSSESRQAFLPLEADKADKPDESKLSVIEVFKKIWVMAFCVTFNFTVTLSVFPAVTVDVKSAYEGEWEKYFIPVCCFLFFNIMDWLGRTVTTLKRWPPKESRLFPALVVSRVVFIPLLMLCNVQMRSNLPVLFSNDAAFSAIMLLFSLSSGYSVCLSMSYAPQLVPAKDAETAGILMTFFLALGLSLGAGLSFPLRFLV
ncbi:equilibrative nucleoside transporter 2 isoform X1 [Alosa sapidissima]|uniref:equilibrative nucleoside transporter 2 isoform X1 n=1 Tax=Alosa sapidissima TaxID=34773 RepID=UPI001C09B712|nr:equilibrative nucleoside transporter 2 isoform X1 [Alosa sapidissima]XP_041925593.1 equilibrative nucleoside transporter 2 isoform X1 [Alosa sapidissima]